MKQAAPSLSRLSKALSLRLVVIVAGLGRPQGPPRDPIPSGFRVVTAEKGSQEGLLLALRTTAHGEACPPAHVSWPLRVTWPNRVKGQCRPAAAQSRDLRGPRPPCSPRPPRHLQCHPVHRPSEGPTVPATSLPDLRVFPGVQMVALWWVSWALTAASSTEGEAVLPSWPCCLLVLDPRQGGR